LTTYKAIFSDIDGTMLNEDHIMTPLTREAVHSLISRGIPFIPVSARSPSGIYPILAENEFSAPIISYSGGLVLDENKNIIYHCGMKRSFAAEIIQYIEESGFDLSVCIYSFDTWLVSDKSDPRIRREERIVKAEAKQGSICDLPEDSVIHKLLLICNPEVTNSIEQNLRNRFTGCSIARSSNILIEIMAEGVNKAEAIRQLCGALGIGIGETLAFGDNYNDLEMLLAAGKGIVMDNAPVPIKEKIGNVTRDHNSDGIYYALKDLGLLG